MERFQKLFDNLEARAAVARARRGIVPGALVVAKTGEIGYVRRCSLYAAYVHSGSRALRMFGIGELEVVHEQD